MSVMAQPYKCDAPGCDRVRENDANHWWIVTLRRCFDIHQKTTFMIAMVTWADEFAKDPAARHFCGIEHAMSAVSSHAQQVLMCQSGSDAIAVAQGARRGPEALPDPPNEEK